MRKFILTILLIMSLYCPKVNATPILNLQQQIPSPQIDDLYTKHIKVEELTVEQAEFLYSNAQNFPFSSTEFSNYAELIIYSEGYARGLRLIIEMYPIIEKLTWRSEKEHNCLYRPLLMFNDEIFARYKNGEVSKDSNYLRILLAEFLQCCDSDRIQLFAKGLRI